MVDTVRSPDQLHETVTATMATDHRGAVGIAPNQRVTDLRLADARSEIRSDRLREDQQFAHTDEGARGNGEGTTSHGGRPPLACVDPPGPPPIPVRGSSYFRVS